MARFWGQGSIGASVFGLLVACSGGSNGVASGTGGGGSTGGATGVGGSSTSGPCVSTPNAVFPQQQFGDSDLIRRIQPDGDTLYFQTLDSIFEVAAAGGTPQLVAEKVSPSEFWVQPDALLVRSGSDLFRAPKAGGTSTPLGAALTPVPDATQLSGTDLYWVGGSDTTGYGIYHRQTSGAAVDKLYTSKNELHDLVLDGDALFFIDRAALEIESLPLKGGTPKSVAMVAKGDALVSGDSAGLYVIGSLGGASLTNYGLYRQPLDGSAAARLDTSLFLEIAFDATVDSSGAYFASPYNVSANHADPTDVAPSLFFASPTDTQTELRWCIDPRFTLHALAVQGKTAYVSVYETEANQATIARVALP